MGRPRGTIKKELPKAQQIRDYFERHPTAKNKDVAAAVGASPNQVSIERKKLREKQTNGSGTPSIKPFLQAAGGIDKAEAILKSLQEFDTINSAQTALAELKDLLRFATGLGK